MLVVLGDWNVKVGEDAFKNWKGFVGATATQRQTREVYFF